MSNQRSSPIATAETASGMKPWSFKYDRVPLGSDEAAEEEFADSSSPNKKMRVQKEGTYRLTGVSVIFERSGSFDLSFISFQ